LYISAEIVKRKINSALILEDDIELVAGSVSDGEISLFQQQIADIIDSLPEDWGVVYLGWCLEKCERRSPVYSNSSGVLFKASRPLCTHAYAVSKAGAKALLKNLVDFPQTLDHSYADLIEARKISAYLPSAPLVRQATEHFQSSNVKRKQIDGVGVQNLPCLHQVSFSPAVRALREDGQQGLVAGKCWCSALYAH
jgi:GR25 family glycosyltransferase involved in LPS biosynthesis